MRIQHYDATGQWVEEEATLVIDEIEYEDFGDYWLRTIEPERCDIIVSETSSKEAVKRFSNEKLLNIATRPLTGMREVIDNEIRRRGLVS